MTTWNDLTGIYSDIRIIKELVYDKCKIKCKSDDLILEKESAKYAGCSFKINSCYVKLRIAKITPTKNGQFVTLWKRNAYSSQTEPYSFKDKFDLYIIITRKNNKLGQFIFPKKILYKYGILSDDYSDGKRGFRVYPPWDDVTKNNQARETQEWQLNYFLEITNTIDKEHVKNLFKICNY
jgi:hypothetical protein